MALFNAKEHKIIFYIRIYQVIPIPQIKINQEFNEFRELVMFRFELEKMGINSCQLESKFFAVLTNFLKFFNISSSESITVKFVTKSKSKR